MPARGQPTTVHYLAWDRDLGRPVTGDVANHTVYLVLPDGVYAPAYAPQEVDPARAPGVYAVALTANESNVASVQLAVSSRTPGVVCVGDEVFFDEPVPTVAAVQSGLATAAAVAALGNPLQAGTPVVLAADGLDRIPVTAPRGPAATFREMVVQTWRRFFARATKSSSVLQTFADDGTTVVTTQLIADDGSHQAQGPAT